MSTQIQGYVEGEGLVGGPQDETEGIDALGHNLDAPTAYDAKRIEPTSGPASRFDGLPSPSGWPTKPGQSAAIVWLSWADEAQRATEPRRPETKRVTLWRLARRTSDHGYVLIPRGVVDQVPSREPNNPARVGRVALRGGALLDSFFEKGEAYKKCRDSTLWRALVEWAQETRPSVQAIRDASDGLAVAILARQGIPADGYSLQHGLVQP